MSKIKHFILLFSMSILVACGGGHGQDMELSGGEKFPSLEAIERATALLNRGDDAGAIAVLDSLSKHGNKDTLKTWLRDILIVKAQALDGIDSVELAKECATRALALPPRNANDHKAMFRDYAYAASVFFYDKEREEDAILWCRKALEHAKACDHDPGSTYVNLLLGNLYLHQSKPMEALALYEEALKEATKPAAEAEYSIQLCNIYKRYGLFEEANRAADIALKHLMSGEVNHSKMKCSALAVKGFCMIALAPDSAMSYLNKAETEAKNLPYNSGLVEIDLYVALHYALNKKDSIPQAKARLTRIIEKTIVQTKRDRAQTILEKLNKGEKVELIDEEVRTTGSVARALMKQSETMHKIMEENKEIAHKNEVMRVWIIASSAIALFVIAILAALLIHLRHRERKSRLIRQHAEKEAQMQREHEEKQLQMRREHEEKEASLQDQLAQAMLAESQTKQRFDKISRRRIVNHLTPELLKKVGFENFRSQFDNYYPEALDRLTTSAGSLGPREQLLCMLLILGVENPRIVELLGITPESVKKARHRLRNKFNIDSELDLADAITKIAGIQKEQ